MKFSLFFFSSNGDTTSEEKYKLLLDASRFADNHGLEAVWTPERHFSSYGGLYPNPSLTAAAIAVHTRRIGIRAGSVIIPLHNPLRVAEDWSVIDNLSNGRVAISFGRGWNANDFVLAPHNFADSKQVLLRDLELVRKLWSGSAVALRNGHGEIVEVRIYPKPIQPQLPIWITAESESTFIEAGRLGVNVLTHLVLTTDERLFNNIRLYHRSFADNGHDPERAHVTLMMHTLLGPDQEWSRMRVQKAYTHYLGNYIDFLSRSPSNHIVSAEDQVTVCTRAVDRLFSGYGLVGTPRDCISRTAQLAAAGVTEIACLIDFGVSSDDVMTGLKYLAILKSLVT